MTDPQERKRGNDEKTSYSPKKARQGEIILRTPLRRTIFFAGLVGFVIFALLGGLFVAF